MPVQEGVPGVSVGYLLAASKQVPPLGHAGVEAGDQGRLDLGLQG
jgi:hypothetical protein